MISYLDTPTEVKAGGFLVTAESPTERVAEVFWQRVENCFYRLLESNPVFGSFDLLRTWE